VIQKITGGLESGQNGCDEKAMNERKALKG
jgi:hypothetical protein